MTDKVKIGVIGLGIMGEMYTRIYSAHPLAEVTAICNRGKHRLDEIGDKYSVANRYSDYQHQLADRSVDAVCVATPDFAHYEPVKAALEAGKHILCEKPFTTDLREADDLLKLAQSRPEQKLQVAFNHRWLSSYYQGFRSISNCDIGKPVAGYARKNDTIWVATEMINWAHQTTPIHFLGAHDIDLMRWYFASEPVEVHAYGAKGVLTSRGIDTYDLVQAQVKFENGAFATIEAGDTKNGNALGVPLNEAAVAVLERQRGKHRERVFTYRGKPLNSANTRTWRKALKEAGIRDFRWHDLRHTWATWLRQADVPTWVLQELGGWKSETMVRRYAHVSVKHLQPYADQLILPDTAAKSAKSLEGPEKAGHKSGHSGGRPRLQLVVSN